MRNVLSKAGACQGLADARWKRLWGHKLAYSGLFVDAAYDLSGFGTEYTLSPKSDPPDYSVAGESTLGTLVIRGEPLSIELRPTKISYGQMSIIAITQNEARPRSVVAGAMPRRSAGHGFRPRTCCTRTAKHHEEKYSHDP